MNIFAFSPRDIFFPLPSVFLNLEDNEAASFALWDSKIFILNSERLKTERQNEISFKRG